MRAEILKRIEIKHQLTTLILVAAGSTVAAGVQYKNVFLLFSFPILSCFLSSVWIANTRGVRELSNYISTHIEPKLGKNNLGWEHHHSISSHPFRLVGIVGSGAMFICTELLAILAGISIASYNIAQKILLVFAILSVLVNIVMLIQLEKKKTSIK